MLDKFYCSEWYFIGKLNYSELFCCQQCCTLINHKKSNVSNGNDEYELTMKIRACCHCDVFVRNNNVSSGQVRSVIRARSSSGARGMLICPDTQEKSTSYLRVGSIMPNISSASNHNSNDWNKRRTIDSMLEHRIAIVYRGSLLWSLTDFVTVIYIKHQFETKKMIEISRLIEKTI